MTAKLTKGYIEKLRPTKRPKDYSDSVLAGFLVRVQPTGRKVYYYRYRINNRCRHLKIGAAEELSVNAARDIASDAATQVRRGICPNSERREAREEQQRVKLKTLRSYVEGPFTDKVQSRSSGRGHEAIAMLTKQYGKWFDMAVCDITPEMILKHRRQRLADGVTPATVRRNEIELRLLINMAVTDGTIEANPLEKLSLSKDGDARIRYLDHEEETRLRTALLRRDHKGTANRSISVHGWTVPSDIDEPYTDHLTPAVLLSLNAGMRSGELRSLRWSDVAPDWSQLTLRAAITKSNKARTIPVNREAKAVLRQLKVQAHSKRWLFPNRTNTGPISVLGKRAWQLLLEDAAITDLHWHDLRHCFASSLVMRRVPIVEVQQLLGHADLRMTLRYAHLAPSALADAVSVLDG